MSEQKIELQIRAENEKISWLVDVYKMLADPNRLKIVLLLSDGQERRVKEISETLNILGPITSFHLGKLQLSGFLEHRRSGRERYYKFKENMRGMVQCSFREHLKEVA